MYIKKENVKEEFSRSAVKLRRKAIHTLLPRVRIVMKGDEEKVWSCDFIIARRVNIINDENTVEGLILIY